MQKNQKRIAPPRHDLRGGGPVARLAACRLECISILRDLGHNASVFYAIWVIMHPFFTRFELFCISFLGAMRAARAVVCRSRENRENPE